MFIARSPGCRQGTILAPVAAWRILPGSKKGRIGLGILDRRRDLRVASGHVCSDANEGVARRAAQADEASRGRPSERTL